MRERKQTKPPPQKKDDDYHKLWRIVDGAVQDALYHHEEYLNPRIRYKTVRESINKRVVGAVLAELRERQRAAGRTSS